MNKHVRDNIQKAIKDIRSLNKTRLTKPEVALAVLPVLVEKVAELLLDPDELPMGNLNVDLRTKVVNEAFNIADTFFEVLNDG